MPLSRPSHIGPDPERCCGKTAYGFALIPDACRSARAENSALMILVGTDGSVPALAAERIAIELATATGDSLLFVTVWRELHGDFGLPLRTLIPDVVDIEQNWAKETVDAAAERAQEAGAETEVETRHGRPAEEICAAASEREARMIVVGASGWGAVARVLLGSVSAQVLHDAPCPVLVVGAA
jgi:nucleotide-binding universal stress UspA family protein